MVTEELTDKKLWNQEKAEINQMIDKIYQPPTYQPAEEFFFMAATCYYIGVNCKRQWHGQVVRLNRDHRAELPLCRVS